MTDTDPIDSTFTRESDLNGGGPGAGETEAENTTGGRRAKPRVPRAASTQLQAKPPPDASREAMLTWLTLSLRVGDDPVVQVLRYGRHEDARIVIVLESGQRITFDRNRDMFDQKILVRRVMIATKAAVPTYGYPDAVVIANVALRLADLQADHDDRDQGTEWADDFLAVAGRNTVPVDEFATPTGKWRALRNLRDWRPPELPPHAPAAERSVILLDERSGNRYVRVADFGAHVRGYGVRVGWGTLHSRMVEIGWIHVGELHQRQPGSGRAGPRVKAHLYAIPVKWSQGEDGAEGAGDAAEGEETG